MGNRIKPVDPEAEKNELRQLTRELHEATRDARAAARELREARQIVGETIDATLGEMLEQVGKDITDGMKIMSESFKNRADFEAGHLTEMTVICIDKIRAALADAECRIAGYKNRDEIAALITSEIHESISELAKDQLFLDDVASAVSSHMKFVLPGVVPNARIISKVVSKANHR